MQGVGCTAPKGALIARVSRVNIGRLSDALNARRAGFAWVKASTSVVNFRMAKIPKVTNFRAAKISGPSVPLYKPAFTRVP